MLGLSTTEGSEMKLSKECKTLRAAERYQNRLYEKYDIVKLIQWPRFGESGNYIWHVE